MESPYVAEQRDDWWYLPVAGMRVGRCFFENGGGFGLVAYGNGGESSELSLGAKIHLTDGAGARTVSTAEPGAPNVLMQALGGAVEIVRASAASRLEICFAGGLMMAVEALPKVEAWQVIGPGRVKAFAGTERGGPSIWDDSSPTHSFESSD